MSVQRVLHIIGKMDRAGAETMLMNLYRQMEHTQIQFDFVTFTEECGDYDSEIIALGGKIIPIIATNPIERLFKLREFLRQHPQYRIVHAHMLLSNAFHLLAAKTAGVPHRISHSHNTSNGKFGVINKAYEKWALVTNRQLATYKIGCGALAAQYLFGSAKGVWLLPNAIDVDQVITVAQNIQNDIAQKQADKALTILQVGRLNEVKNHQFSLQVAKQLQDSHIDFTLYIIGQGPLDSEIRAHAKRLSLADNVTFLGVRTDIIELMAGADYMIMPSLHEGFPVVLVESQAAGLKALVSDQISDEVDLGLGLVEFLPIHNVEVWVSALINKTDKGAAPQRRAEILKSKGFDVSENAKKLAQIYMSFD